MTAFPLPPDAQARMKMLEAEIQTSVEQPERSAQQTGTDVAAHDQNEPADEPA